MSDRRVQCSACRWRLQPVALLSLFLVAACSLSGSAQETGTCADEAKAQGMPNFVFNEENSTCACGDGYLGPACAVCTSDVGCNAQSSVTSPKLECFDSIAVTKGMTQKTMACQIGSGSILRPFLPSGIWGRCDLDKRECGVNFGGANATQPHIQCNVTMCDMSATEESDGGLKTTLSCKVAECGTYSDLGWPSKIPTWIKPQLMSGKENVTTTLTCESPPAAKGAENATDSGMTPANCTFTMPKLPFPVDVSCSFGDCIVADSSTHANGSLNLQTNGNVSQGSSGDEYQYLPIELIFLPILVVAAGAAGFVYVVSVEWKKQHYRSIFRQETKRLKDVSLRKRSKEHNYSAECPAVPNAEVMATSLSDSHATADVAPADMAYALEVSFVEVECEVYAKPEDERWLHESPRTSAVLKESVRNFGLSVRKVFGPRRQEPQESVLADIVLPSPLEADNEADDGISTLASSPRGSLRIKTLEVESGVADGTSAEGSLNQQGSNTSFDSLKEGIKRKKSFIETAIKMQFQTQKRRVLHGLNGSVQRGNMLAIMGPSGCGKSTFLNILAGERTEGTKVKGKILCDGHELQAWYRCVTVYIPQSDELIPILTVRESILCAAQLRLPWYYKHSTRQGWVEEVLANLKIENIADSQVGGSCGVRGISGGERRRVSIGVGLVANPKIIILDEPTSGLDSANSSLIIKILKDLATKGDGRIVVASLHQPNSETFENLDLLMLLAKGRQVYFGPANKVGSFFSQGGFECPMGLNVADYILHVVSDLGCLRKVLSVMPEAVHSHDEGDDRDRYTPSGIDLEIEQALTNLWSVEMYRPASTELHVVFVRTLKQIWRRPLLLRLQVALAIVAGVLSIIMFKDMDMDVAGVQNRIGFFFFQLAFFGFASISSTDMILEERNVFLREIQGKFYSPLSYFFSKVLVDGLMLRALPMLVFDVIVYWSIGLRSGPEHVLLYFLCTVLFSLATGSLSIAVTMGSKTGGVASLTIILLLLFSILFGGFLSNRGSLPAWISWAQYLSPYYQATGVLVANELKGQTFYLELSGAKVPVSADVMLDTIEFSTAQNLTVYVVGLVGLYVGWLALGVIFMYLFLTGGRPWKGHEPLSNNIRLMRRKNK